MDTLTGTRNSIRGQLAAPCPGAKANPELAGPRLHFWASWPRRIMVWGRGVTVQCGGVACWVVALRGSLLTGHRGLPPYSNHEI